MGIPNWLDVILILNHDKDNPKVQRFMLFAYMCNDYQNIKCATVMVWN